MPSIPDPFEALERQLASAPGAAPQVLESLGPPDEEAPDTALDFLFKRLTARLDEAVARVAEEWGPPGFHGTVAEGTFPVWSDALVLAHWWHDEKVAWLGVRQEDDADPLTLEAGAHTRDELEGLRSWHPAHGTPPPVA